MKKIKFLGTAILAASLLFAGCSSPVEDVVAEEDTSVTLSPEETGSNSGTTNGGSSTGGNSNGGSTGGNNGSGGSSTGGNEVTTGFTVSFSDTDNTVTSADDVYTVNLTNEHGAADEWGNQIFIKNPNAAAGVKKGDLVKASVTVKADKEITTFFFKNQYNGGNYTGTDTSINLPANTEKVVQVVGTVTDDYDDSSSYVIAIRGNEANTTLTIKDIKSEVLSNYEVTSVSLAAKPTSISAGEKSTLSLNDQYGIAIADATFKITSESVSTLAGNILTAGDQTESVTVKGTYGNFEDTITIEVTADKDYAKYFKAGSQTSEVDLAVPGYMALWYVADPSWNCGDVVTVSDVSASNTSYTITRSDIGINTWSTQMFYKENAGKYNISFKIESTADGDITINTKNISLTANSVYEFSEEKTLDGLQTLISLQFGGSAGILPAGTFTITDFSVTPASAAE